MNLNSGKFVSFEGADAAGKSTQIRLASEFLTQQGIKHIITREPGGTPFAEKLRNMLITEKMRPDVELLLMMTARREHVESLIKPALARGEWVLTDRFIDSSYAYQGGGREYPVERIKELQRWVLGEFAPDMTFMFEIPKEVGILRTQQRVNNGERQALDKFEAEKEAFFERVRAMYKEVTTWPENLARMRRIDASGTIQEVFEQIKSHLLNLIYSKSDLGDLLRRKMEHE